MFGGLVLSSKALVSINEVALRWARLVLGWATVSRVQLQVRGKSISVYNQPDRSTQPGHPSVGISRGGATVLKVGGQILRAKRAEKFFLTPPPLFGQWGGTKYCLE